MPAFRPRSIVSAPDRYCPVSERGIGADLLQGSGSDHVAAVHPGAGPEVDDVVRRAQRLLVVLDDDEGVADVAQVLQRVDEKGVVPLVETDGGLVEDVQHADQGGPDLRGKAYPLRLAAAQGACTPLQGQVVEAHILHEREAGGDLFQDLPRDLLGRRGQGERREKVKRIPHGQLRDLVDVALSHRDGEHLGLQAPSAAGLAVLLRHEPFHPLLDLFRAALQVAPLQVVEDTAEPRLELPFPPAVLALVAEADLLLCPVQQNVEDAGWKVFERGVQLRT